jgi:oligopeptide/dipeptide ABC transporter ATP-binding protein
MSASLPPPSDALLQFDQVCMQFDTRRGFFQPARSLHALTDISFSLRPGEILGVVGESGSGKSTLGKLALRLLDPSHGTVSYAGRDLAGYRGRALKRLRCDLQMVFQDPHSALNGRMSIEQCLLEPLQLHRRGTRAEQQQEIRRLLDVVNLPHAVLTRYPHELSGGQKQRIVIARALALKPRVLVADEAVAALDASVKAQITNLLLELREQLGLAIVFITHDLPLVHTLCDRVLVLYLGRMMELAPRQALRDGGQHPYTQALWRSSPVADPEQHMLDAEAVGGEIPSPLNPPAGCVFHTRCPHAQPRCGQTPPPAVELGTAAAAHSVRCWLHEGAPAAPAAG